LIEAAASLGANKWHPFPAIQHRVESLMGDAWEAFASKPARNAATGKDVAGRLLQSLMVLQRVRDYGKKLAQMGAVIDLKRKGEIVLVRLNTRSTKLKPEKLSKSGQSSSD
jgi:hypothetical protein